MIKPTYLFYVTKVRSTESRTTAFSSSISTAHSGGPKNYDSATTAATTTTATATTTTTTTTSTTATTTTIHLARWAASATSPATLYTHSKYSMTRFIHMGIILSV